MQVRAILFDTRSIQKYIFSDNRLRTNIGASYIVSHVFEDVLLGEILKPGAFGLQNVDTTSWKSWQTEEELLEKVEPMTADCYVAYIGGGNALLLFPDRGEDVRKELVSAFTETLLVKYPGLKTGAAIGELALETGEGKQNFKESMDSLYGKLKENQFSISPLVNVINTGLTLSCEVNGEVANAFVTKGSLVKDKEPRFFSQEVWAKAMAADKADAELTADFADELAGGYSFPKELERLGQRVTENDIAVVHIDGNNMGSLFAKCNGLAERSDLSKNVSANTKETFKELLKYIVAKYDSYKKNLNLRQKELPIRPLILGGDDITFICNAKLALCYTKKFMSFLMDESIGGMSIDSCAGIAIVPTSYPFFRAYELAEQLCGEAKKSSRKLPGSSWLDFAILHGEQAPTIEQIREQEYKGALGDLHFGPYRVDGNSDYHFHLDKLLQAADGIVKAIPRSKYKEMRSVLQRGQHDINRFIEQLRHDGKALPHVDKWEKYEEKFWDDASGVYRTPYIDAIEIIDYIPPKEAR